MVKQFFIPTLLGALIFLWLMVMEASIFRTTVMSYNSGEGWIYTQMCFGHPTVLEIRPNNHPPITVYWKNMLMVCAAAYVLAIPLGRWMTGYRAGEEMIGPIRKGWRSPAMNLLMVLAGCPLLGLICVLLLRGLNENARVNPWLEMWWGLTFLAMILLVPFTLTTMAARRVRWRRAFTRRGFAVEMST